LGRIKGMDAREALKKFLAQSQGELKEEIELALQ
jgi:hypothetical protein